MLHCWLLGMCRNNLALWPAAAFFWLVAVSRADGPRSVSHLRRGDELHALRHGARVHDATVPALNATVVLGAPNSTSRPRPTSHLPRQASGVFFIRVPKTGSTTVREIVPPICEALGVQAGDFLTDNPQISLDHTAEYKARESVGGYHCANQHIVMFDWHWFEAFPSLRTSLLVSVVREPLRHAYSLLHNEQNFCGIKPNSDPYNGSITAMARKCYISQYNYLGGGHNLGGGVVKSPLELVNKYDVLLVLEQLVDSIIVLLAMRPDLAIVPSCKFALQDTHRNQNAAANTTAVMHAPDQAEDERGYRKLSKDDFEVYRLAKRKLDSKTADAPRRELHALRLRFASDCK